MKTNSVLRKINDVEHVPRTTIKLQWNRSFGTPLIRVQRFWSPKNVITSSLYLLPILNGHLHQGNGDTISGSRNHSGVTS